MIYKFFSCSSNILRGLSAYKPLKLVVYCLIIPCHRNESQISENRGAFVHSTFPSCTALIVLVTVVTMTWYKIVNKQHFLMVCHGNIVLLACTILVRSPTFGKYQVYRVSTNTGISTWYVALKHCRTCNDRVVTHEEIDFFQTFQRQMNMFLTDYNQNDQVIKSIDLVKRIQFLVFL